MRPRMVLAGAALTASLALVALPGLAGSTPPSGPGLPETTVYRSIDPAMLRADAPRALGSLDPARRSAATLDATTAFADPGTAEDRARALSVPAGRPVTPQPRPASAFDWKPARYTITGIATFYDNGTTAMRLPRGTIIRVCGAGGCIERVVSDYGPFGRGRIVDLHRPDFFAICGCASWAGTAPVTVYVY